MEEVAHRRCKNCGSIDVMYRLNAEARCWRCGVPVPTEPPAPRPLPDLSSNQNFRPLSPPPPRPTQAAPEATFIVPATLPKETAERVVQSNLRWFFRPADIDKSEFSPLSLLYMPLWRIDAAIESFYIGLQHSTGQNGMLRWVVPTGGFRHRDGVVILSGRRFYPIDPSLKIVIPLNEMQPLRQPPTDGEVLAPDVHQQEAEVEAAGRLRQRVQPQGALYARFEARVRSAALCYYPLWVQRYRYQGSAAWRTHLEECHVAVSGRSGKIVSARHPSALWSMLDRAKRMVLPAQEEP